MFNIVINYLETIWNDCITHILQLSSILQSVTEQSSYKACLHVIPILKVVG